MVKNCRIIHCSYHKCLTVYYAKVMEKLYNTLLPWSKGYRHFNSRVDEFYENLDNYKILSVNNHKLDFERLGEFRLSRFVRDPRDMIVSGYFYHKRGAEDWCNIVGPKPDDWKVVNGNIPKEMGPEHSYSSYLQSLSQEEGLLAEIEFRKHHYESMLAWPTDDPRIVTFRYEDILGHEQNIYGQVFEFYELPWMERIIANYLVGKYAAKGGKKKYHIRNPEPNQWKKCFTPRVSDYFHERYSGVLDKLGYDPNPDVLATSQSVREEQRLVGMGAEV